MTHFDIKTYSHRYEKRNPHFFILNKGLNSGKPLKMPCPNCFVISCDSKELYDFFYWLIFGLWRSNAFHPFLKGSVILFITINDMKKCILRGADQARENLDKFNQDVKLLKLLEQHEENYHKNLKLIEDARKAIFYKYRRYI